MPAKIDNARAIRKGNVGKFQQEKKCYTASAIKTFLPMRLKMVILLIPQASYRHNKYAVLTLVGIRPNGSEYHLKSRLFHSRSINCIGEGI